MLDTLQRNPGGPHHGVPDEAFVPHLNNEAKVQPVDLTERFWKGDFWKKHKKNKQKTIQCYSIHIQWTRIFYIITARLYNWLITKVTSFLCCVLAVIIHSSLVLSFNMLLKWLKNSLMTATKWHIHFERSRMTRAFAYSRRWQFTTIDGPNKGKMREKIIKENS